MQQKDEVPANTTKKDSVDRERTPPPSKNKSFGRGSGSAAGSSEPEHPKHIADALAKRPSDRTDAETLLAASAAKAGRLEKESSKPESWADASEEMDEAEQ